MYKRTVSKKDVRLSVPSVAIPYGQRFIKIKLAAANKLVELYKRGSSTWAAPGGSLTYTSMLQNITLYINNIFVNPEVHDIFIKRIGFSLIRVHRQQTYNANQSTSEVLLQQLKWPIEFLQVGMKIKDYGNVSSDALRREHMDKWHRFSKVTSTSRCASGWRSGKVSLKNAAYTLLAPVLNNDGTVTDALRLTSSAHSASGSTAFAAGLAPGDLFTLTLTAATTSDLDGSLDLEVAQIVPDSDATAAVPGYILFKQSVADAVAVFGSTAATVTGADLVVSVSRAASAEQCMTVDVCSKTVDTLTIKAHGIPIYDQFPQQFYNAYVPYHYGGPNVRSPKDCGVMFVNFSLYPGTYQPSGHINVSRAREFYLEYVSSEISSSVEGTLVVN